MVAAIEGDKQLQRALKELKESAAKRAIGLGLRKAAQEGAKYVKATVPSKYKNARRGVGWRSLKRRFNRGEPGAKVGAGVGKRQKTDTTQRKIAFIRKQNATRKRRSSKGGVGITANNIHWLILGAGMKKPRYTGAMKGKSTGKPVRYRGRMEPQMPGVAKTLGGKAYSLNAIIRKHTWAGIQKELAKLRNK
jgi:hypothetical protein